MKKVFIAVLSFMAFATVFIACTKSTNEKNITLIMAEVNPEDSICGRMDNAFKEKVEELSNGSITIDIRYSGSLGDEKEVIKLMQNPNSSIHLCRYSANLSNLGETKSALISIPYTFVNSDHFWKFAKSDIAQSLLEEPYKTNCGVRGLCYAEEGFRSFFSTEKISDYKQLEGKKMRVSGATLTSLAKAFNAEPVNVAFTDLYKSMQLGETEVAEQPLANYLSNSFHIVAPYLILDRHMLGAVQILITSEEWDKLSENQQKILKEAADYASDFCKEISTEQEEAAIKTLVEAGVTITDVPDNSEWHKKCEEMIKESSKEYADLYEQIVALGK